MPKKYDLVSLSDNTIALILGSLLGDGSLKIHGGYTNARFTFRHSLKQLNYFNYKVSLLDEISSDKSVFYQKPDGFSPNGKVRYQSKALPSLTELYNFTHKRGQFQIRRNWLNQMTDLSLAIWWLDDCSIISNTRKGVFCTDGFDEKSVKILARYLQVVWNIDTHVGSVYVKQRTGNKQHCYRIWIRSSEELKKLCRIVAPHIHELDMLYKVIILYKDSELQQRWISELVKLTDFTEEEITSLVNERKAKLKIFQKKI